MKQFTIRIITMIMVQQSAMIFFMRVVRLQLFESAGISALMAMMAGLVVYFVQKHVATRKGS